MNAACPASFISLIGEKNGWLLFEKMLAGEYWRPRMTEGSPALMTHGDFSDLLNTRRLTVPDSRLVKNGVPVPFSRYCRPDPGNGAVVYLDIPKVIHEICEGATLAIDFAEDLFLPARDITDELSVVFQEHAGCNFFFTCGSDAGFSTHWDNSDILVFQLIGQKRWRVYAPTEPFPVESMRKSMAAPAGPPDDDCILTPGDVLYLPRGFWHTPEPCDGVSLHISFAFRRRNGTHFLSWLTPAQQQTMSSRRDIDMSASAEEREKYLSELKSVVAAELSLKNLDAFMNHASGRAFRRERFSLQALMSGDDSE